MAFRFMLASVVMSLGLDSGDVQGIESWFRSSCDWMQMATACRLEPSESPGEQAIDDDLAFESIVEEVVGSWSAVDKTQTGKCEERVASADQAAIVEGRSPGDLIVLGDVPIVEEAIPAELGRQIEAILMSANESELPDSLFAEGDPTLESEPLDARPSAVGDPSNRVVRALTLTRQAFRAWLQVLTTAEVEVPAQ